MATTSPTPPTRPPSLTNELLDLILSLAVCNVQQAFADSDARVTGPLNALSRSIVRLPTQAALLLMPFVPLETPAALGDLHIIHAMAHLAQQGRRPLSYSSPSPNFLTMAASFGHLLVLDWWFANKAKLRLFVDPSDVLAHASQGGFASILHWWHERNLPLHVADATRVWTCASEAGHMPVLRFWLKHALSAPTNSDPMDLASGAGHVDVLDFWMQSGMSLEYSHRALLLAVKNKHYSVLDWWARSDLRLVVDEVQMTLTAVENADLQALEWLDQQGLLQVKPGALSALFCSADEACISYCMQRFRLVPKYLELQDGLFAAVSGLARPDRLDTLVGYGFLPPKARSLGVELCLEAAARVGSIETLEWWRAHEIYLLAPVKSHFHRAVIAAAEQGHVQVLDWLHAQAFYSHELPGAAHAGLIAAASAGHLNVLEWFAEHHPRYPFPVQVMLSAVENGHADVVEWWLGESGTRIPSLSDDSAQAALLAAAQRGHVAAVKPWFARVTGSALQWTHAVLQMASAAGQLGFIKWWVGVNGARESYLVASVAETASEAGALEILEWLLDMNLFVKKTIEYHGINVALRAGKVEIADWWYKTAATHDLLLNLPHSFTKPGCFDTVDQAAALRACTWLVNAGIRINGRELPKALVRFGEPALIHQLLANGVFQVPTRYSVYDQASRHGRVALLEWWNQSRDGTTMQPRPYSNWALRHASRRGHVQVLDWWLQASGLDLKLPYTSLVQVRNHAPWLSSSVVEWWEASGLLPDAEVQVAMDVDDEDDLDSDDDLASETDVADSESDSESDDSFDDW